MPKEKKKQDACEYSKDEFLNNPVACANDVTGYVQRLPYDIAEAQGLTDLTNATVDSVDGKESKSKAR